MAKDNVDKTESGNASEFLKKLKDFALVVGEECPEGHRRDPASGACLPIAGMDHTAFTRSLNDDQGPEWRGEVDKTNETFDDEENIADRAEVAVDAEAMEDRESCAHGTTFSFIQGRCVTLEEAETEDSDEFAMTEEGEYVEEAANGHEEVIALDPEGRRDPVNHDCPPNQFFDYKNRMCIPLNKDTVMASEDFDDEFKQEVATYAKLAISPPDVHDGHRHVATLDEEGNGVTSMQGYDETKHSHVVKGYVIQDAEAGEYTSRHLGYAVPEGVYIDRTDASEDAEGQETAAPIKSAQRRALPASAFGVPGKRKFPLDTCARVRNAMARFNQAKGLTSAEKATLRRKILARAKACNIEVKNFAKAETAADFRAVMEEMMPTKERVEETYGSEHDMKKKQGPCPPGMMWNPATKKCEKARGFIESVLEQGNHAEVVSKQPEGRRDTVNHDCPPGEIFDYKNRTCIPLDPSAKEGRNPGATASEEEGAKKDLAPLPKGKPARLPQDCPPGTIWDGDLRDCKPLDSRKKTKSAEAPAAGPGKDKDENGCGPGEFLNPVTKKCMPRKGAFKGKSEQEEAQAVPGNREGLTEEVPGKVKLPSDCPPGTIWDGTRRTCTPLSTMDKNRPSGSSGPQNPKDVANEAQIENLSLARVISHLDEIIKDEVDAGRKEKANVAARELPNEAFPPSLVSSTRRALMHHNPEVADAYDNETVDVARLRNALARVSSVEGFAAKAVEDAKDHLLFHAREIIKDRLGKN